MYLMKKKVKYVLYALLIFYEWNMLLFTIACLTTSDFGAALVVACFAAIPILSLFMWKNRGVSQTTEKSENRFFNFSFSNTACSDCGRKGLGLKLNGDGKCHECEVADLKRQIDELATDEYKDLETLRKKLAEAEKLLQTTEYDVANKKVQVDNLAKDYKKMEKEYLLMLDNMNMQEFGIYDPNYEFLRIDEYKEKLTCIRQKQKDMIKSKTAASGASTWTVNGNLTEGRKMVSETQKLILRAFNGECDELVSKVKYNNLEASISRIEKSCETISKLGRTMQIAISPQYKNLKIEELKLAFEYAQAKQKEKEELKAHREQMREEAKLLKEIEEQRSKILKEQTHYANAIAKLNMQLSKDPNNEELKQKLTELQAQYDETEKAMKDIDYREANKRAGYVYIISNVGSFGENVYKIGMTRRLEPQDRIDELSDASVPFNFDVHAMIFTDDAPALETALHNAFADKKVNLVNHRREFFNVTLDEIKKVVKDNYDKTVEFIETPDAEQFRISQDMRKAR